MPTRPATTLLIALLAGCGLLGAQNHDRQWSGGTGLTLPKGRFENGLFRPLRYGRSDRLEWATYRALNLVLPNLRFKLSHGNYRRWDVASRIGLSYPTLLLRILQRPGIGGFISPEADVGEIPHILAVRVELLGTRSLTPLIRFTAKGGLGVAFKSGKMDERTTIDLPLIYPGMVLFLRGYQINLGGTLHGEIGPRLALQAKADLVLTPSTDASFAFHHRGGLVWRLNERLRLRLGYILMYAEYPFGPQWHLLPTIGLEWAGKR